MHKNNSQYGNKFKNYSPSIQAGSHFNILVTLIGKYNARTLLLYRLLANHIKS